MSRRAEYHLEHRFIVTNDNVEQIRKICSKSEKFTWITSRERLKIHTLLGVPSSKIDLLLPDNNSIITACEIGLKIGHYDSAKRWRLTFRSWPTIWDELRTSCPSLKHPSIGKIIPENHDNELAIIAMWKNGFWAQSFTQLQYKIEPGSRIGIIMYHWKTYYKFLPEEDVRAVADYWENLPHTKEATDIVVLNRSASSILYDLARQLGWRKLTIKDRKRYGIGSECPQWVRSDDMRLSRDKRPGIGQYSDSAAIGRTMRIDEESGFIRTSYGLEEID